MTEGKQPKMRLRFRIALWIALILLLLVVFEWRFHPLLSDRFLTTRATADAWKWYAKATGAVFAGCLAFASWRLVSKRENKRYPATTRGELEAAFALFVMPVIGYFAGTLIVAGGMPFLSHQFAPKSDVALPFEIVGYANSKICRGIRATNPAFYDDELCRTNVPRPIEDWIGRTVMVSGRQSRYGLFVEDVRVERRP